MIRTKRLLIVDDERNVHYSFRRALEGEYEILSAHDGESALVAVDREPPDVILLDVRLPRLGGLETLQRLRESHPGIPVIVMTAFGTVETAIRATALSARDYLVKPIDVPELRKLLAEVVPDGSGPEPSPEPPPPGTQIVGQSAKMQELFKLIGRATANESTVLLTGESGTGKELVARALHDHGRRGTGPFVPINCAAIPATLLESELFGHERGAFTGADAARPGKFELAHRGTLLLDEIGEMDVALQAKLLRVLQGREVARLGGSTAQSFDVRVIAATNVDLDARVAAATFREDLYYRLNVLRIHVPALRERDGDIWRLACFFLERERSRLGRPACHFAPGCQDWLAGYSWPGNVRELENVVARAVLRARGDRIQPTDLMLDLSALRPEAATADGEDVDQRVESAVAAFLEAHPGESFEHLERLIVSKALTATGGNQVRAAKLLGISRNVIRKRMAKHSL